MAFCDPKTVLSVLRNFPGAPGANEAEWFAQVDRLGLLVFGGLFRYPLPAWSQNSDDANADAARALVDWVKVLRGFDDDVLERAWLEVVSRKKAKPWQALGDIVAACRERAVIASPLGESSDDRELREQREREAVADTFLAGSNGRQVFEQGIALAVQRWIEREGRVPDRVELERIGTDDKAAEQRYQSAIDKMGPDSPHRSTLIAFRDASRRKERQLRQRYLGEAAA